MRDEDKSTFIYDTFLMYYDNAKKAQSRGDLNGAKENLLRAAQALIKLAKNDTGELKKARFERAKRLIEIAENLESGAVIGGSATQAQKSPSTGQKSASESDDDSKQWKAATIPDIKFSDVAGLEDVKQSIRMRMINPVKYPEKYARYGKKSGGGVLLYGPPGTGKTMIAKAIANEVGATFYAIKGSDIVSKWVGESEKNISSLFETARKDKLAIIFIDEMDSLFGQRGNDPHNDKRVNEFLQQIDGFVGRNPNLLLLGATNRPWDVDGAAVRSGRFSEKIYVPLPDAAARKYLLKKQLSGIPIESDVDFDVITKLTEGYSGADIDEICDRAKDVPLNNFIKTDVETKVSQKNIVDAIKKVRPMVDKKEIARFEEYAGRDRSLNETPVEEEPVEPTTPPETPHVEPKAQDAPTIELESSVIAIQPGEKPTVRFFVDGDYDRMYLEIDGKHYSCDKCIRNWSCAVDIDAPGTYVAEISSKNRIGNKEITFIKGVIENDMEI